MNPSIRHRFASHAMRTALTSLLLILTLSPLTGCSVGPGPIADPGATQQIPVRGAIDDRDYRYFTLANGLQVLLVSDPATDKAAASLAVNVGSFDESDARPGLAHFLEHMLFLGTEKYPAPEAYNEFIARHGGSHNAYTALDHTNYFFSIASDQLYGGLDRFAQFFVAPLFTAQYVDREKNAVHSEYQMQLRDDGWRTYMTQKRALNPEHPGSRFTIGSLETLEEREGPSVRDELLSFYRAHYSAERMALVIQGQEDLDTLAGWATELFADVPRRNARPAPEAVPVFRSDDLPSLMRMVPVKERRVLEFSFALPALEPLYRIKPGAYVSSLLGHEGPGSLHAQLRELGWIESLSAGSSAFDEHNGMLTVSAALTQSGLDNWEAIGELLFAYVEQIRSDGIKGWRYREQAELSMLAFNYREKSSAAGYVRSLASNLFDYPPEDVLRGPFLMEEYDAATLRRILDRVRPELAQVTLIAPDLPTDQVEPYFDVRYAIEPLPAATVARWQRGAGDSPDGRDDSTDNELRAAIAGLALPAPNPFVPEDLTLLAEGGTKPQPLTRTPALRAWHLADPSFGAPRAQLLIDLRTASAGATPMDAAYAQLFTRLVTDSLNEFAYPARLAGLSYSLSSGGDALTLRLGGFDDRLDTLLQRVLATMQGLDVRPDRFALFKSELLRDLRNSREDRPYQQTMAELRRVLEIPGHPLDAMLDAAAAADPKGLEAWMEDALASPQIVALLHGNLTADRARSIAGTLGDAFPGAGLLDAAVQETVGAEADAEAGAGAGGGKTAALRRLVRLDGDTAVQRGIEVDHGDAAFSLYVQGRDQSWLERARFGMLAHLIRTPYFNALRTDQQLGYVVSAGPWVRLNTPGMFFVVQSPVASPAAIETATSNFLNDFTDRLAALTPEQFEAERAGLLSRVMEGDKNLGERSARLWSDLDGGIDSFDSREQLAAAIRSLTVEDMRRFHGEFLELAQTRRASTWTAGRFELPAAAPTGRAVEDTEAFKRGRDYFTTFPLGEGSDTRAAERSSGDNPERPGEISAAENVSGSSGARAAGAGGR